MKTSTMLILCIALATNAIAFEKPWYEGDLQCPPPPDNGHYAAPYNPLDHPNDYPTFADADKPGWSCSHQRDDGVIVQYGDSRTPQEQWLSVWGRNNDHD